MASKFNTEFNYRYQVIGETPWEKIKTLQGFLEGRVRAAALEEVSRLKNQAKVSKLKHLQNGGQGLEHEILELKAEILEAESFKETEEEAFKLNQDEIKILKKLLKELTIALGKEIQAEIIANGRPSPAKIRNAMRNPKTWNALKAIGMVPEEAKVLTSNINPTLKIELKGVEDESI